MVSSLAEPLRRQLIVLWIVFFLICLGLGYPILNRYDPGKLPGTSDAAVYCDMVRAPLSLSHRIFVPALAKPFYLLGKGRIGTWDPALFGMLISSSILSASTAVTIIIVGLRAGFEYSTSMVGAMLFLFNFAVANWNLSGYVDSGEALFLALLTWCLFSERWYLLPLWAIPGCLSKNTFAPFSVVFATIWLLVDRPIRAMRAIWICALAILCALTVFASLRENGGLISGALNYTRDMDALSRVGFFRAMARCLKAREFWYVFVWLLPLGVIRIRQMDRRWAWAVAGTFLFALILGSHIDALGNTSRAFFNIAGPLLSLSAAQFLVRTTVRESRKPSEVEFPADQRRRA
jgi:hypothetical protein